MPSCLFKLWKQFFSNMISYGCYNSFKLGNVYNSQIEVETRHYKIHYAKGEEQPNLGPSFWWADCSS